MNKDCIEKIMLELDINKAIGPDNLRNLVYTNLAKTVSKSVLLFFQTLLNKGIFPETWKLSEVVPIFKDGNKCDIKRYRPMHKLKCYGFGGKAIQLIASKAVCANKQSKV